MGEHKLQIIKRPRLDRPRMLMGFTGWMDSGDVSTGTVNWLTAYLAADKFAYIEPEGFYIYNFPGTMEMSSLFRPHTRIVSGRIRNYIMPENIFYASRANDLILFSGREPNMNWQGFSDLVFAVCSEMDVGEIYFIGSVAGLVPHTREPRILCSVSDDDHKVRLAGHGVKFTDYEGPASFVTHLTLEAAKRNVSMSSFIASVPAYIQGENPKCIEAMLKMLKVVLDLDIELEAMRQLSDEFEKRLTNAAREMPELAETIEKLETDYDKETFDVQMGDLKDWLHQKGIRLD
ncbi:MAG: PAC2 family protein [Phycisphaerae bacterium]|nr:PAC2 family protein [Phycisphaerae bacterium]